jgi:CheY-like chemotaxis protein
MTDEPTNILIVDDLPEKLLAYRTILDELGQNIVTARSGEEALRAVLREDFAVILLDVQMPGMSGLETAGLIRKRKRSAHTPIIFVTAFDDEVRAAEGYAQGAVDYITTPVVPGVLRAKVRVFADLYRMTQQIKKQAEERITLTEERTKRAAAEEANRRLAFLTRAGEVLGQSLERRVTARAVVRLPLPLLADEAILVTLRPDGTPSGFVRGCLGADGTSVSEGMGTGPPGSELDGLIDKAIARVPPDPAAGSALILLLRASGRVFALLGLSRAASGRSFPRQRLLSPRRSPHVRRWHWKTPGSTRTCSKPTGRRTSSSR